MPNQEIVGSSRYGIGLDPSINVHSYQNISTETQATFPGVRRLPLGAMSLLYYSLEF